MKHINNYEDITYIISDIFVNTDAEGELTDYYVETILGECMDDHIDTETGWVDPDTFYDAVKWVADNLIPYMISNGGNIPPTSKHPQENDLNFIGFLLEDYEDEITEIKNLLIQDLRASAIDTLLD